MVNKDEKEWIIWNILLLESVFISLLMVKFVFFLNNQNKYLWVVSNYVFGC